MAGLPFHPVWLVVAAMVMLMVIAILATLAMQRKRQVDVHDVVRQARLLRAIYVQDMIDRGLIESNVDVVEEPAPPPASIPFPGQPPGQGRHAA